MGLKTYKTKSQLLILKAKIKGLAEEGVKTRKFISSSFGEKRDQHWKMKRTIGQEARLYLIAYGLLRGVPYSKIEPNSDKYQLIWIDYNHLSSICKRHCWYFDRKYYTPDNLRRLLTTGTMSYPVKCIVTEVSV